MSISLFVIFVVAVVFWTLVLAYLMHLDKHLSRIEERAERNERDDL